MIPCWKWDTMYRSPPFNLAGYIARTVILADGTRYIALEHREVAEAFLGRKLLPGEVVHHRDGDKKNNDPSNLEVMSNEKHASLHSSTGVEMVTVICVRCGSFAIKRASDVRGNRKKGKAGPFCGKYCAGKYSKDVQMGCVPE